jgi:hypothetical protein
LGIFFNRKIAVGTNTRRCGRFLAKTGQEHNPVLDSNKPNKAQSTCIVKEENKIEHFQQEKPALPRLIILPPEAEFTKCGSATLLVKVTCGVEEGSMVEHL